MIESPFRFEETLADADYQLVGKMSLRWSHTDHLIGNCLKTMLRLSEAEAVPIVFQLSLEQRLNRIGDLLPLSDWSDEVKNLAAELKKIMKAIQYVRNTVIHAIMGEDLLGQTFHLRSKQRNIHKGQLALCEEITNYAGLVALHLRFALGFKPLASGLVLPPLPDRPAIPEFLLTVFQDLNPQKTEGR